MPASSKPIKVACRGGRNYAFSAARTALVVIDMQRDFFGDEKDPMRDVIPRVAKLMAVARQAKLGVFHTREGYAPDLSDVTPYRKSLGYVGRPGLMGRYLIRGERGQDFVDELRPLPDEGVVDKPGFSGFYRSDLHARLREAGVTHLILCGVTTQCCVHSTLREAVDLGYWCLTVADCCAAEEVDLHEAALSLISGEGDLFGWVCDLDNLLEAVGDKPRRVAAKSKSSKK